MRQILLSVLLAASLLQCVLAQQPQPGVGLSNCEADVVFILDHSGSIRDNNPPGIDNWKLLLNFVKAIISALDVGLDKTRIGLVMFSNDAETIFDLDDFGTTNAMLNSIDNLRYDGGFTNTARGFEEARTNVYHRLSGDRPEAADIIMLITDGVPTLREEDLAPEVTRVKEERGIRILAIGITSAANETLLRAIATDPVDEHYFHVDDFSALSGIISKVVEEACGLPVVVPSPTPQPGSPGATGPAGPTGPRGNPGPQGAPGTPGSPGSPGNDGNPGSPGRPGSPGSRGLTGSTGATGRSGSPGQPGTPGASGSPGSRGFPGPPGPSGDPGSTGPRGFPGPSGNTGSPGPIGFTGPHGFPGRDGATGASGQPGPPGTNGLNGRPGPTGSAGMPGPGGATGATGSDGPRGFPGSAGQPGPPGSRGLTGGTGASGRPGPTGPSGPTGRAGPAGFPGPSGPSGATGHTGPAGFSGPAGSTGQTGATGLPGSPGRNGPPGRTGGTGASGNPGPRGFPGNPGPMGGAGQSGSTGATGLSGPPGPVGDRGMNGFPGPTGQTGSTGPQGAAGQTGGTGSPGRQGRTGATGSPGFPGPTGRSGPQGPPGPSGATGSPGRNGNPGRDGFPGSAGPAGNTGATGRPGTPGNSGSTGRTGATGLPGAPGRQGAPGPSGAPGRGVSLINECLNNNGGCSHLCTDRYDSYYCSCRGGYRVRPSFFSSCQDPYFSCALIPTVGLICWCSDTNPSRPLNNTDCVDINECSINNGGCKYGCSNNDGSYTCTCPIGFSLAPDGRDCEDINECLFQNDCNYLEVNSCVNTYGSYYCIPHESKGRRNSSPSKLLPPPPTGRESVNGGSAAQGGVAPLSPNTVGGAAVGFSTNLVVSSVIAVALTLVVLLVGYLGKRLVGKYWTKSSDDDDSSSSSLSGHTPRFLDTASWGFGTIRSKLGSTSGSAGSSPMTSSQVALECSSTYGEDNEACNISSGPI